MKGEDFPCPFMYSPCCYYPAVLMRPAGEHTLLPTEKSSQKVLFHICCQNNCVKNVVVLPRVFNLYIVLDSYTKNSTVQPNFSLYHNMVKYGIYVCILRLNMVKREVSRLGKIQ